MKLSRYRTIPSLKQGSKQQSGRNNDGRITTRHRGGGHKQSYRAIDWSRSKGKGIVVGFEYDPQRTARLAKLYHEKTEVSPYSYMLAPSGVKLFQELTTYTAGSSAKLLLPGDTSALSAFEPGDFIHNVEAYPGTGAIFARAAGSFCQVRSFIQQNKGKQPAKAKQANQYVKVRLPSGSHRLISFKAIATVGTVASKESVQSKGLFDSMIAKKAGRSRWLGWRPTVRGVARNPVDHPHGGGQGKTSGGRPSVTFKSRPAHGQCTRNPKRKNALILTRRKNKNAKE